MKIYDAAQMHIYHDVMLERCDKCSAKAKHEVTLVNGGKLLFCKDHWEAVGKHIPGGRERNLAGTRQ
jgi:hypothetical protein